MDQASELLAAIERLSVAQLKAVIDSASLTRDDCLEKDDLRERALEAAAMGAPLPEPEQAAPASHAGEPSAVSTPTQPATNEPIPAEKAELLAYWTETALRIQLVLLNRQGISVSARKERLAEEYWQHLLAEGTAYGEAEEVQRRWLRVLSLDRESQAARYIEALTDQLMPPSTTLQAWLRSGVILCDFANVLLSAVGFQTLKPTRDVADGSSGDGTLGSAAASRLRIKQMENIALYTAACRQLKVDQPNTFDPEDLYEGRNMASVVKNVHALAHSAHKLVDWRGPQMGPVMRKERSWVQRASVVAQDWRTAAGVQTSSQPKAQSVLGPERRGGPQNDKFIETAMRSASIAEEDEEGGGGAAELTPLEQLRSLIAQRGQYAYVETAGLTDEEATLRWIEAVIGGGPLGRPLSAALRSGSALCKLVEAIEPGTLKDAKLLVDSTKPFEQMAAIDGYLKACQRLGLTTSVFTTVDVTEGRDSKAVVNQLWALALLARSRPQFLLRGPHLAKEAQQQTAKLEGEKNEKRIEKLSKLLERERKRVEKAITQEEVDEEKRLLENLQREREEEIDGQRLAISEAKERAQREKERRAQQAINRASRSGWLYKRGGMAKVWRKRWFAIEDGAVYYYMAADDRASGKPPLGSFFLANASVRRPTDPKSKGKYQSTCMRLDLDPDVQVNEHERRQTMSMSVVEDEPPVLKKQPTSPTLKKQGTLSSLMVFGGAKSTKVGLMSRKTSASIVGDEDAYSTAAKEKNKYLLAAESVQGLADWMEAIEFWSRKHGDDQRRSQIALGVTAEEMAALRARAAPVPTLSTIDSTLFDEDEADEDEDEDEDEEETAAAAAAAAAEQAAAAVIPDASPEKQELMRWSSTALLHQIDQMGGERPPKRFEEAASGGLPVAMEPSKRELAEAYWATLVRDGKEFDDVARRWLVVPKDSEHEVQARLWLECLLDAPLPPGPLQPQLRSGEVLCEAVNAVCPGIVPKVARAELLNAMSENRRHARMRENIGQFVDACAELGVAHKELFLTADLFENKNWKAVLKSVHGLARHAHHGVPGFQGPHVGIRKRNPGGVTFGSSGNSVAGGLASGLAALTRSTRSTTKDKLDEPAAAGEAAAGEERERSTTFIESTRL